MSLPRSVSFAIVAALLATLAGCSGPLSSTQAKVARRRPAHLLASTPQRAFLAVRVTEPGSRSAMEMVRFTGAHN
jgi:hypothetical protein